MSLIKQFVYSLFVVFLLAGAFGALAYLVTPYLPYYSPTLDFRFIVMDSFWILAATIFAGLIYLMFLKNDQSIFASFKPIFGLFGLGLLVAVSIPIYDWIIVDILHMSNISALYSTYQRWALYIILFLVAGMVVTFIARLVISLRKAASGKDFLWFLLINYIVTGITWIIVSHYYVSDSIYSVLVPMLVELIGLNFLLLRFYFHVSFPRIGTILLWLTLAWTIFWAPVWTFFMLIGMSM